MENWIRMAAVECYQEDGSIISTYINIDNIEYITDHHMEKDQDPHIAYKIYMNSWTILKTYHDLPRSIKSSLINADTL
jgi:hypothetical protein